MTIGGVQARFDVFDAFDMFDVFDDDANFEH